MQVKISRMGNSQGIHIPKPIIEECGLGGVGSVVEMTVRDHMLVVTPLRKVREGWKESLTQLAADANYKNDIDNNYNDVQNDFDENDWEW